MNFDKAQFRDRDSYKILEYSPVATAIYGSEDLTVEFANNAMLEIWQKDHSIIGMPLRQAFSQTADEAQLTILQDVWRTGESYNVSDVEITVLIQGELRKSYFNCTYRPLKDDNNQVYAIFHTALDVSARQPISSRINGSIASSEPRFLFMLNAIPQQVWTSTPDGALDYVNQVVCDDFGYTTDEIVGHGWQKFIHPEDLDQCLKKWAKSLATGRHYMVEFRLLFSDGTYRWHLGRAVPYIEDGKTKLWLGTNTDIEVQKENEIKKDEFLSIASHELKTPLTSIKAFNQLLQRVKDPEKIDKFVQKSSEHIARLERLISDLLDVTKINAGKVQYDMELFNVGNMIRETVNILRHTAPNHKILLHNVVDTEFYGDQFRLELVMSNFISNAIKYSPEGKQIIVESKIEDDTLVVSVQDFGIGIAEHNLDKLFDRYYRVDNTAMRFEGLGLGLFISSEILTRHKGSFWIESTEGEGSTFYFGLPLHPDGNYQVFRNSDSYYQDSTVTMLNNKLHRRIEVDWTGFQNFETVQRGCLRALEMIKLNKCTSVLNDNRNVLGTWSEASDWAGEVYFPMMEREGIKKLAWIFSPSVFGQLSAKKSIDVDVSNITTQFFTEIEEAKKWLEG